MDEQKRLQDMTVDELEAIAWGRSEMKTRWVEFWELITLAFFAYLAMC